MEDFLFKTDEPLATNSCTMSYYLDHYNVFNIVFEDGTYAEIKDFDGQIWALNASGDGDFCSHRITFKAI